MLRVSAAQVHLDVANGAFEGNREAQRSLCRGGGLLDDEVHEQRGLRQRFSWHGRTRPWRRRRALLQNT